MKDFSIATTCSCPQRHLILRIFCSENGKKVNFLSNGVHTSEGEACVSSPSVTKLDDKDDGLAGGSVLVAESTRRNRLCSVSAGTSWQLSLQLHVEGRAPSFILCERISYRLLSDSHSEFIPPVCKLLRANVAKNQTSLWQQLKNQFRSYSYVR